MDIRKWLQLFNHLSFLPCGGGCTQSGCGVNRAGRESAALGNERPRQFVVQQAGAYSWDTKPAVVKGEQGACSFRCSRHHVETTGLTSGTAVCLLLRRNKEKERDAVEEFFMACWRSRLHPLWLRCLRWVVLPAGECCGLVHVVSVNMSWL